MSKRRISSNIERVIPSLEMILKTVSGYKEDFRDSEKNEILKLLRDIDYELNGTHDNDQ